MHTSKLEEEEKVQIITFKYNQSRDDPLVYP
jgi:hypothetical protein